jgi:hypothetical protein
MKNVRTAMGRLLAFYYEGFRDMSSWGKKAWLIILIKLFIIFAILRLFFFPDLLKKNFSSDAERSNYVRNNILNTKQE